jgi:hypothetical protein
MIVSALKQQRPPADPLRAALAEAIENEGEAKKAVEHNKSALHKTRRAIGEVEVAISKAEKGIEEARLEAAAGFVDTAGDDDDVTPVNDMLRLARVTLADSRDTLETLKLARDQLRQELPDLEAAVKSAGYVVDDCISAILAPIAAGLIDRLRALVAQADPLRLCLPASTMRMPIETSPGTARGRSRRSSMPR